MKRIKITSQTGHFGEVHGIGDRVTYDTPPPSTIIGMLRVIFGEDILEEDFKFGYTFKSEAKYKESITIYKHNTDGYVRKNKASPIITDCGSIESIYDCELYIYTDIKKEIKMEYAICMGKSGNPARLHLPIQDVDLVEKEGEGYNQYTPIGIGHGIIKPTTLITRYNSKYNAYDSRIEHLRYNKKFEYPKNYDEEIEQNIVIWKYKDGEVSFDD